TRYLPIRNASIRRRDFFQSDLRQPSRLNHRRDISAPRARDVITFYGISSGITTPSLAARHIASRRPLATVDIREGDIATIVQYDGLVAGQAGLYQLNVVIPDGVSCDVPPTISIDGVPAA